MNKYCALVIFLAFVVSIIIFLGNKNSERFRSNGKNIPVFYINLDRDKTNRKFTESTLKPIFSDITRIPGVLHRLGREGCRLAHIKANMTGIAKTKPGEYYIVFEDDIQVNPNAKMSTFQIQEAIKRSANTNADMIMFNIQNYPYDVQMVNAPANIRASSRGTAPPEFYRLLGGVGSGAAYMVKHEFGKKLVDVWRKHPMQHIDLTWHSLWPSHIVLVHRPLLFLQRVGPSRTDDTTWRDENDAAIQDFNWNEVSIQVLTPRGSSKHLRRT